MRVIGYIDHPAYKISVFSWSEKYIVKIEAGFFEQSYKFPQSAYNSWEDLKTLLDEPFMEHVRTTFHTMGAGLKAAMLRQSEK